MIRRPGRCRDDRLAAADGRHFSVFIDRRHVFIGRAPRDAPFRRVGGHYCRNNGFGRIVQSFKRQTFLVKLNIDRQHHDNLAVVWNKSVFFHVIGEQLLVFSRSVTAQPVDISLRDRVAVVRHDHLPVRVTALIGTNPARHSQPYAVRQRSDKSYRRCWITVVIGSVQIQIIKNIRFILCGIAEYFGSALQQYNAVRRAENAAAVQFGGIVRYRAAEQPHCSQNHGNAAAGIRVIVFKRAAVYLEQRVSALHKNTAAGRQRGISRNYAVCYADRRRIPLSRHIDTAAARVIGTAYCTVACDFSSQHLKLPYINVYSAAAVRRAALNAAARHTEHSSRGCFVFTVYLNTAAVP